MDWSWEREQQPRWDSDKRRIVGGAPQGIFDSRYAESQDGATLPGEWWRVERDGDVVGYGWLEQVWGDGEILLATDTQQQGHGIGTFIVEQLDKEAARRGLNYVCNIVRPTHPDSEAVVAWLSKRGFQSKGDGRLVRRTGVAGT